MAHSLSTAAIHRPDAPQVATPAEPPAPKMFGRFTSTQIRAMSPEEFARERELHEQRVAEFETKMHSASTYTEYRAAFEALQAELGIQ